MDNGHWSSMMAMVEVAREGMSSVDAPLVVGLDNPVGRGDLRALFPAPPNSSGDRLYRLVMDLDPLTYLRSFYRTNLVAVGQYSPLSAPFLAANIVREHSRRKIFVLLGERVAGAFGFALRWPFAEELNGRTFVGIWHPSGLCRKYNDADEIRCARMAMSSAIKHVEFGSSG